MVCLYSPHLNKASWSTSFERKACHLKQPACNMSISAPEGKEALNYAALYLAGCVPTSYLPQAPTSLQQVEHAIQTWSENGSVCCLLLDLSRANGRKPPCVATAAQKARLPADT